MQADIDPYTDPYQNLKDDHYTDYTNFDEPISDNKIRDEIQQMQFSVSDIETTRNESVPNRQTIFPPFNSLQYSWIGENSLNHGSAGDYQDDPKISNDVWDWLSDSGQKSSSNVNTNFDDFFADFESHFANPLVENDGDDKFPLNDFNAKADDFGPLCTFGVSDSNANLWPHISTDMGSTPGSLEKSDEAFSNLSFDDAVFDAHQSSNMESQAIYNSTVPVTNHDGSVVADNVNNSNDQQVPNTDTTTEYSQNTNKDEM